MIDRALARGAPQHSPPQHPQNTPLQNPQNDPLDSTPGGPSNAEALGAQVFRYRDESGLEADVVVELADGRWAAFEVKLGAGARFVLLI